MREYSKVGPKFWIGETGKALRKAGMEAQIVAMYLMTSPHANMLGLYYCPMVIIAHETGLPLEGASKGLQRAIEAGFCEYDEASEVVWVLEMAAYQVGESLKPADNRVKGVQGEFESVPKNPFLTRFYEKYGAAFCMQKPAEIPQKPEAPSKPLRSQEQEQEQEQEKSKSNNPDGLVEQLTLIDAPKPSAERLAQVTADAINAFNASKLVKGCGGMLPSVNVKVGFDRRKQQVKRCIKTARDICTAEFGSPVITPEFWEAYWQLCADDPFLSGRGPPGKGHENWVPDFEFLTRPKTILRAYDHSESAA